ncbi:MAG TPA: amidohydrolase [Candidatus Acetothermia bacterium]|nr:amidohydrolase [Candidatus Acetothermia bacterium]
MSADVILYHGLLLLGSPGDAVAVRCGHIQAVGKTEEIFRLRGPETQLIDLEGRPLLPGFFDAHVHFVQEGLSRTYYVDLSGAASLAEALEMIAQAARARPGEWVVARGWDESTWPERRYLERRDLDRAVPKAPACAVRVDGHLVAANTLALARCGRPEGEHVDRARGHLWEEAVGELLACARPGLEHLVEAVAAASRHAAELGVTAVADMGGPQVLAACQVAEARGELNTRVFLYLPWEEGAHLSELGVRRGFGSGLVRIQGLKVYLDGSIGARTAALSQPYADGEGQGELLLPRERLVRILREAERAGLQVAMHAIGDRAIEEALTACEQAGISREGRHRIEHLELPTEEQLARMKRLGLVASMQPNFAARWSGPGKMYEARLGKARDEAIDPHAWVVDRGIPLAFGSDGMPMGPLYGLPGATDPPHAAQRLPVEEALQAYTWGGAYATGSEGEIGEICPGRWADLVVLSADPRNTPWDRVRVHMTFLEGKLIYKGT